jgi:hypothetical protein
MLQDGVCTWYFHFISHLSCSSTLLSHLLPNPFHCVETLLICHADLLIVSAATHTTAQTVTATQAGLTLSSMMWQASSSALSRHPGRKSASRPAWASACGGAWQLLLLLLLGKHCRRSYGLLLGMMGSGLCLGLRGRAAAANAARACRR